MTFFILLLPAQVSDVRLFAPFNHSPLGWSDPNFSAERPNHTSLTLSYSSFHPVVFLFGGFCRPLFQTERNMFGALIKKGDKKPAAKNPEKAAAPVDDKPFSYRRAVRNNWKTGAVATSAVIIILREFRIRAIVSLEVPSLIAHDQSLFFSLRAALCHPLLANTVKCQITLTMATSSRTKRGRSFPPYHQLQSGIHEDSSFC